MAEPLPILSRKAREILRFGGAAGIPGNRNLAAKVARLDRAMPGIVRDAARLSTREAAKLAQRLMSNAFEREHYYAPGGVRRRLGRNTTRYNRWKVRAGRDPRRGHNVGRLQDAIDDMVQVSHTGYGIRLELRAAAARSGASAYLDSYEEKKAPGLGDPRSIPRQVFTFWERSMRKRVRRLASDVLNSVAAGALIPKLLSDRQIAIWIGKVRVELRAA